MISSDSEMSDNDSSKNSRTESEASLDAKNQRRKKRTPDVKKDAHGPTKDSDRSTRDRAEADRSNGPTVPRGGKGREDAHSGGASAPTTERQATKADATEWQRVEPKHKRKKETKDKEPMPKFVKKASRVPQEEIPSSLVADAETIINQFDSARHDGTTVFVGAYRGNEDDIRQMIHRLNLDNALCAVNFGKNGPAFIRWKTHPLARKFLTRLVESPEIWRNLGGYIPHRTYLDWARIHQSAQMVGARPWHSDPVQRPFGLRHFGAFPGPG